MGASAVLLFAAPHGPLSQPWNVIGGHIVSAFVGIACHYLISDPVMAGAVAVGVAISAMYYLHCLHPPGGATALVAAMGGTGIDGFGFIYIVFPIGLGAILMVLIAIVFNYAFPWRRYPEGYFKNKDVPADKTEHDPAYPDISHANLVAALSQIDGFVDISEEELIHIYELATSRPHTRHREPAGDQS